MSVTRGVSESITAVDAAAANTAAHGAVAADQALAIAATNAEKTNASAKEGIRAA